MLIDPGILTDMIGILILGGITIIQYRKWKADRSAVAERFVSA